MERVFTRLIAEVCNPFAVRRPCGVTVSYAGRIGEVASIALISRYADDFTARFKDGARSGGRKLDIRDPAGNLFVFRTDARKIAVQCDVDVLRLTRFQIEEFDLSELIVNDGVRTSRC